jgi:hypothetical protein
MKALKHILFGATALVMASCMDGGYPDVDTTTAPYGNNEITEENVITIQELKDKYKSYVTTSYTYTQITEDVKIKGHVVGNDIEGNIYNEVALQDATGAIIIAISQGGMCGYMPEGAEILVSLKDLYIGNYGAQAEVGVPYTNSSGSTYVSRMPASLWQEHFKITGYDNTAIQPTEFTASGLSNWNGYTDGGKLGTLKNVSIRNAKSTTTWSDASGTSSVSLYFNEINGSNTLVYTSPYCDFANVKVPQGKFNITGIFKNYNGKCEIIIRKIADIEEIEN